MNLLIVESPSKAKTIEKYLGRGWHVIASVGHVRDLVPENGSVDTEHNFNMHWQIMPGKEKQIKLITDEVKKADAVYLASDPDREGEAIAWHILDILNDKKLLGKTPVYRVAFHEITKTAVNNAIANPREIDSNLVDAYMVRRALDYLIGFEISPLLWRRNLGKSAGRVQSVAVRLVVDREREIEDFVPTEYWSVHAKCDANKKSFGATLVNFDGNKIEKMTLANSADIERVMSKLQPSQSARISRIDKKKTSTKPYAPFTTSTLQQEAARKLYFSSKKTMSVAQKLYENGFITYMRTDATNLSIEATNEIRNFISKNYGPEFLPNTPNIYVTKSKNAQEAHEAIRPTHFDGGKYDLDGDEKKLYDLIWRRTIACQMTNAEFDSVAVDILTDDEIATFHSVGRTRTFDGFMKVYIEDKDDSDTQEENAKLPPMNVGDKIIISEITPEQHFTQPPARYTEASLVKKLEELGIGRPSTYATIMSTIVERNYVEQDRQRRFHPTSGGWVVAAYLTKHFTDLVDVNFTAKTEDTLDDVSTGKTDKLTALQDFWGDTKQMIAGARDVKTTDIINEINNFMSKHMFADGNNKCPKCGGKLGIKLSKFGPFIGCENYPTCDYAARMTQNDAAEKAANTPKDLGNGVSFRVGKFGPYVTDGTKNASAKKYNRDTITLEIAMELLSSDKKKAEPIEIGKNPKTDKMIYFYPTGRYGAYISSNRVNVSVKEQPDLETAIELINNKKPKFSKK